MAQTPMTVADIEKAMREMKQKAIDWSPMPRLGGDWMSDHLQDTIKYSMAGKSPIPPISSANVQSKPDKFTETNMLRMIASRMGWDLSEATYSNHPFGRIVATKLSADAAVVFIVHKETALVIHDDLHLFPSDALVTQLRLLLA